MVLEDFCEDVVVVEDDGVVVAEGGVDVAGHDSGLEHLEDFFLLFLQLVARFCQLDDLVGLACEIFFQSTDLSLRVDSLDCSVILFLEKLLGRLNSTHLKLVNPFVFALQVAIYARSPCRVLIFHFMSIKCVHCVKMAGLISGKVFLPSQLRNLSLCYFRFRTQSCNLFGCVFEVLRQGLFLILKFVDSSGIVFVLVIENDRFSFVFPGYSCLRRARLRLVPRRFKSIFY